MDFLSSHIHPLKEKVKKPKTKASKADSIEKVTVAQLYPELENPVVQIEYQPYGSLFQLYRNEFLDLSVSQPNCDSGWDSSNDCYYRGYDLYMLVASGSESDLPVFPSLNPASTLILMDVWTTFSE